jgi:hypothetical protein
MFFYYLVTLKWRHFIEMHSCRMHRLQAEGHQ